MNFPLCSRARRSSAGVLGKEGDKSKPNGDGDCQSCLEPPRRERCKIESQWSEDGVAARPAGTQRVSVSNYGNEADPHLRENSVLIELNNSEGHECHDSSTHTGKDAYSLPYSDDQSEGDKHRKKTFL